MMTTDELLQHIREVKLSQVRKQLEIDREPSPLGYLDYPSSTWISRAQIVEEFFIAAKRQKE